MSGTPETTHSQHVDPFDRKTWGNNEREYFGIIDKACADKRNAILSNGKPAHAAYIIVKFFENATQRIRLFSGHLTRQLEGVSIYESPHIINAASVFLNRPGTSLSILLEKDIDVPLGKTVKDHPFIRGIEAAGVSDGQVIIKKVHLNFLKILRDNNYAYNWMVMDEQAFRLEMDPDKVEAYVNFGDPPFAKGLGHTFDALFERSSELYAL